MHGTIRVAHQIIAQQKLCLTAMIHCPAANTSDFVFICIQFPNIHERNNVNKERQARHLANKAYTDEKKTKKNTFGPDQLSLLDKPQYINNPGRSILLKTCLVCMMMMSCHVKFVHFQNQRAMLIGSVIIPTHISSVGSSIECDEILQISEQCWSVQ